MKILLCFLFYCSILCAGITVDGPYLGPTSRLIERDGRHRIEKKMRKYGVDENLEAFFDSIALLEDWGHIGYHGANQVFRVYQDIIRCTLEEILRLPIREDFHFFRVPGDGDLNLNSILEFEKYWGSGKINNKSGKRAEQLLSLNFAIYSNYDNPGSCSIYLFVDDMSKNSVNYSKQLAPFYLELGISPEVLADMFKLAERFLSDDSGVLFRLFEISHHYSLDNEAYNFLDEQGYPCRRAGYRWGRWPLSKHFECVMSDYYLNAQCDIAPQLRLLLNNRHTLNPYSNLSVERYDLYREEVIIEYEKALRQFIGNLRYDPEKVAAYRRKLLDLWSVDEP